MFAPCLPGPPLRARCLQTKMQIHDRVSGFSRKIEQIIAPAPLVTNPLEKYIFWPKRFHLVERQNFCCRKTIRGESQRQRLPNQSSSSESKRNPFWRSGWEMCGQKSLGENCKGSGRQKPLTPIVRWRQYWQTDTRKYKNTNTNTQILKYTNTQIHKYTNTVPPCTQWRENIPDLWLLIKYNL